jgi:multisubunit Na+/H+ antiporter MnhE subunit
VKVRSLLFLLAWWPLLFGLWVLLLGTRSLAELLVGAVCAVIAVVGAETVRHGSGARFSGRAAWVLPVLRVPARVVVDSAVVFAALAERLVVRRRLVGALEPIHFEAGGDHPRSAARRALAIWLASAPPNTVALGIDETRDVLLVHRLAATRRELPGSELASELARESARRP